MKNTYGYLIIIIIILIILFKLNFTTSTNTKESFDMNQELNKSDYTNIDPLSLQIDVNYMNDKSKKLEDLKRKLNKLREFLYNQPLDKIIQLKAVYKNEKNITDNNHKFSVKLTTPNNFNNLYTIEVPNGEKGPRGEHGEDGEHGEQGEQGEPGPVGNCGLCIK